MEYLPHGESRERSLIGRFYTDQNLQLFVMVPMQDAKNLFEPHSCLKLVLCCLV